MFRWLLTSFSVCISVIDDLRLILWIIPPMITMISIDNAIEFLALIIGPLVHYWFYLFLVPSLSSILRVRVHGALKLC